MTERVNTTPKDSETYNSSSLYDFMWKPPTENDDFEKGKLIVRFQTSSGNRPSSVYLYDVSKTVFEKMKDRALNPNEFYDSAGEFFNNKLIDYVDKSRYADHLYNDKHNMVA